MEPPGEISVMDRAMNNPIVSQTILKFETLNSLNTIKYLVNFQILSEIIKRSPLKTCRLVCQFWNEMVLSLPNTTLALNLEYEVGDYNAIPFFDLCFTLDDRLSKQIVATCTSAPSDENPSDWIDIFAYRLTHVCDKFNDSVQILEITVDYAACLQSVFQVLKNCCPNLKQLEISYDLNEDESLDFNKEILLGPLLPKPKLTLLTVRSEVKVTPSLTSLLQLVVNASPNLREATIPWGFCPDFANSKLLGSLTVKLELTRRIEDAMAEFKPLELTRLLNQVADQLVNLGFSHFDHYGMNYNEAYDSGRRRVHLPKNMPKLQKLGNKMVDIFPLQDIKVLSALKTLEIGKIFKKSRVVDELLENMYRANEVFANVRNLTIFEIQNPKLVHGLKTAFPNLERLELDTRCEKDFNRALARMNLGVVLNALKGWEGLKHLNLKLPNFSRKRDAIQTLLNAADLYKGKCHLFIN